MKEIELFIVFLKYPGGLCEAHTDPGGDTADPRVQASGDILGTVMGWLSDQVVGGATTFFIGPDLIRMWPTR